MKRKEQNQQQQQQNYNRISQAKVENVLKRVEEYIQEGKKKDAFNTLNATVSLRKGGTKIWTENYELTMQKFVELCVDLRKGPDSKQGLAQYRNICQTSNMDSFINIIDLIINLSEKKLKDSVQAKDEAEIEASIKFLWDTYRNVLELSKSNPKLEAKYELIATKGFEFCLEHRKKQEFRKLSETVRTHSPTASKTDKQVANLQLQTKFKQLIVACELELYQDAFKAAEEIHTLLSTTQIQPSDSFMANYYQQLVKIFWVSKNYLFHAVSLFRLYNVKKKSLNSTEKSKIVSNLLLAMLCIQNPSNEEDLIAKTKLLKMSTLIGSTLPPTKESVYEQFNSKNLLSLVYPDLQEAYKLLIEEYNPLEICIKMESVFKFLSKEENKEFSCYIPALQEITVHRFIEQISQVYSTIRIDAITKIVTFMNIFDVERIIVQQRSWNAEIDHVKGIVTFTETLESPNLREQLVNFAKKISSVHSKIKKDEIERKSQIEKIGKAIEEERDSMIKRRLFLERKKKWEEDQERYKEKLKQEKAQLLAQQRLKEDEERIKKESEKREELRKKQEEEKQKEQEALKELKKLLDLEAQTLSGKKKSKKPIDLSSLSAKNIEELLKIKKDEIEKEQLAKEKRLQDEVKNIDYLERAKREIEVPRIEKKFEEIKSQEIEDYHKYLEEAKLTHHQKLEKDRVERERLLRMKDGKEKFLQKEIEQRKKNLEEQKSIYEKKKEEERIKWEEKRNAIMEEIERRKEKERKKKEEEEKLKKIAEIQRQKEEEIERKLAEKKAQSPKTEPPKEEKKPSRWGNLETESKPKWGTTTTKSEDRWSKKSEEPKKEESKKEESGRWSKKPEEKNKDEEGFETVQKKTTGSRWK